MNAPEKLALTGIVRGLSNEDYHAGPGVSKSSLDAVAKSPAHYFAKYLDPQRQKQEQTPAMLTGTLAHCAILEPAEFDKRYAVGPDVSKATKEWKTFEALVTSAGQTAIKPDQRAMAFAQSNAIRKLQDVAALFEKGEAELSAFWTDEATGLLCKCRPDWVHECEDGGVILVDVKTTSDASLREFSRSIAKWRYHAQAAWYIDGYQQASGKTVHGFMFVAVENDYPHATCAYMLDDESLDLGRETCRRDLDKLAGCLTREEWPGYSNEIEVVSLPYWAFNL